MQTRTFVSYPDLVRRAAALRPDGAALIIDDERRDYRGLLEGGERWAHVIAGLGLASGDRLGVLLPNLATQVEILLGASMLGVVVVPINTRFKAYEIAHVVSDSKMAALVTCNGIADVVDYPALLDDALPGLKSSADPRRLTLASAPDLRTIVTLGDAAPGLVRHTELAAEARPLPPAPDPEHPLLLMYTSGTTARPKGCIMSHRSLTSSAQGLAGRYQIGPGDVWWCPLPMFHIGGHLFMTVMFAAAGLYVGMSHFTPEAAFDLMEQTKPTVFYPLFPTITLAMTDHPRFASVPQDSIRYVFSVATPEIQRKIQAAFPKAALFSAFGMTETCGAVTFNTLDDTLEQRLSTCGSTLPGWQVRIVDPETREELPLGERGEIAVRGDGLFSGYFGDPELTKRQFLPDGFFLSGDIGALDEHGLLRFFGRLKDQIKVGGENVSALEVESFLATHPAVKLAQVVGLADEKYGEVCVAFVEPKAGASVTEAELQEFCAGKIARFKIPRHVRVVSEWPMSATKILKYRLRERIAAELAG